MAKINKDTLNNRIVELQRKAQECNNKEEKAFLLKDAEYLTAQVEDKPTDVVEKLAEETKALKDSWLKSAKKK